MRRFKATILFFSILYLFKPSTIDAQLLDTAGFKKTALPIIFYLPETSLGFGGSVYGTFRLNGEPKNTKPSSIIGGASYTLKNQILFFLPYEIYKNNEDIRYKGEIGYYRYVYNYFGLGPDSKFEDKEIYNVTYPRVIFNYSREITQKWKLGMGFKFDEFNFTKIEEGRLLDTTRPVGINGGTKSVLTLQAYTDTRDNTLSAYSGYYIEGIFQRGDNLWFSDYEYNRFELDARYFHEIRNNVIFGMQFYMVNTQDTAPFFDIGYAGDAKHARGFPDRRFINYNIIATQAEIRYPLFWRLRGATFLTNLLTPTTISKPFEHSAHWSIGTGVRFMLIPEDRTLLRFDLAYGADGFKFYLTANEAF